ncbi:hypothetical protein VTK56DRAFT_8997 [Thermocarpiscus australiensis]
MSCQPQTPQSPSQLSPGVSDPTMSITGSAPSTTTTLPTPAHSVNGSSFPSETPQDVAMGEDSPQKRKRPVDDMGDRAHKKVHVEDSPHKRKRPVDDLGDGSDEKMHVEDRKLGIDDLHLDVGAKYLLCRTPHPLPRPNVSEDLFERYNLTGIAAEVARVLPDGTKNALRKTYKGHIKRLGVQGHFDSVKEDPARQDGLLALMKCPEDVWDAHFVRGKDIHYGFSNETQQRLLTATTMARGFVPKSLWDSSVLGELNPGRGEKQTSSARPTAPNTPLASGGLQGFQRTKAVK